MKNKFLKTLILFTLFLTTISNYSHAVFSLSILSTTLNYTTTTADFTLGYKEAITANTLTVSSTNTTNPWYLYVRTTSANMGSSGKYTKPLTDFFIRATGTFATMTTYTNVTSIDQQIATGARGTNKRVDVDHKTLFAWNKDVPGTYSIALVYTLVAN